MQSNSSRWAGFTAGLLLVFGATAAQALEARWANLISKHLPRCNTRAADDTLVPCAWRETETALQSLVSSYGSSCPAAAAVVVKARQGAAEVAKYKNPRTYASASIATALTYLDQAQSAAATADRQCAASSGAQAAAQPASTAARGPTSGRSLKPETRRLAEKVLNINCVSMSDDADLVKCIQDYLPGLCDSYVRGSESYDKPTADKNLPILAKRCISLLKQSKNNYVAALEAAGRAYDLVKGGNDARAEEGRQLHEKDTAERNTLLVGKLKDLEATVTARMEMASRIRGVVAQMWDKATSCAGVAKRYSMEGAKAATECYPSLLVARFAGDNSPVAAGAWNVLLKGQRTLFQYGGKWIDLGPKYNEIVERATTCINDYEQETKRWARATANEKQSWMKKAACSAIELIDDLGHLVDKVIGAIGKAVGDSLVGKLIKWAGEKAAMYVGKMLIGEDAVEALSEGNKIGRALIDLASGEIKTMLAYSEDKAIDLLAKLIAERLWQNEAVKRFFSKPAAALIKAVMKIVSKAVQPPLISALEGLATSTGQVWAVPLIPLVIDRVFTWLVNFLSDKLALVAMQTDFLRKLIVENALKLAGKLVLKGLKSVLGIGKKADLLWPAEPWTARRLARVGR